MENEIIINGESTVKDKPASLKLSLSLFQLVISLAAVLVFLIIKGFFPVVFTDIKEEYESRMYDSIFAEIDDRGTVELE